MSLVLYKYFSFCFVLLFKKIGSGRHESKKKSIQGVSNSCKSVDFTLSHTNPKSHKQNECILGEP